MRWKLRAFGAGPARPAYTLIFLHIPKTAGISLRDVLVKRCGPSFQIIHPIEDQRRLAEQSPEFRAGLGLVEGHQYYGVHELLPRPCVYVTMLREPVDRVLSYYSYIREWEPHHLYQRARNMTLAQRLSEGLTVELDYFMVRCLTSLANIHVPFGGVTREMLIEAKAHLDGFAGIGLTEAFGESLAHFCGLFGWPVADVPRLNATRNRVGRGSLSEADLALVRRHNGLDEELYAYAQEMFFARLAGGGGEPKRV